MKRYILYFITCLSFAFVLVGCAQWGGDNPIGITGGSEEGYGQNNDLNLPIPSDGNGFDSELVSTWRSTGQFSYAIFTFNSNNTFTLDRYVAGDLAESAEGTYSVSGNILTLHSQGDISYIYSINKDTLTLTSGDQGVITLHRVIYRTS